MNLHKCAGRALIFGVFRGDRLIRLRVANAPRGALLAYLALEGLKLLEHLDFHHFAPAERARIVTEIAWLAVATPAPAGEQQ